MTAESRSGSCWLLEATLLILLAAGVIFAGYAPVVRCPECSSPEPHDTPVVFFPDSPEFGKPRAAPAIRCTRCGDSSKIPLLNLWLRASIQGKVVSVTVSKGFRKMSSAKTWSLTGILIGKPVTQAMLDAATIAVMNTGSFDTMSLGVVRNTDAPGTVKIIMTVTEKP